MIWGPSAWLFLHTITFNYPENPTQQEKDSHYQFFTNIENVLPCETCREHYKKNVEIYPIQLDSRDTFIRWLITIHNQVNIMNGAPTWTYDEVYDLYKRKYSMSFYTNIRDTCAKKYPLVLILIIICLILYILYGMKVLPFI